MLSSHHVAQISHLLHELGVPGSPRMSESLLAYIDNKIIQLYSIKRKIKIILTSLSHPLQEKKNPPGR
jgi:hypothetical protein